MSILTDALKKILNHNELSEIEMEEVMAEIFYGDENPAIIGGLLMTIQMRGIARSELTGAAKFLKRHATHIDTGLCEVIDIVGTGGDGGVSFNISTTSAFVISGAGLTVAKHGNRAMSGKSGSADVLAASGFNLNCPAAVMEQAIAEIGIGFLFAQKMHPILAKVSSIRKTLATRTMFNLIGPLCNPANASSMVVGVYASDLTELIAGVLHDLGVKRAMVVNGLDGLDEISVSSATRVSEIDSDGSIRTREIFPELILGNRYAKDEIAGGTPEENAVLMKEILSGKKQGATREIVLLNAAAAICTAGKAKNLEAAFDVAKTSIDSGAAFEKFNKLMEFSRHAS